MILKQRNLVESENVVLSKIKWNAEWLAASPKKTFSPEITL